MSNSMLLFFFLSSFFISSTSSSSSSINTTHKCSVQQTLALVIFKQNLTSINVTLYGYGYIYRCEERLGSSYKPKLMNWNTSTDCCDWNGVTCDHSTGDIIGLDLSCGMIKGIIHPNTSLFNLPRLQRLNLAYNDFTHSRLPPHIGRLSNSLTHFNVSYCEFTGQVPADISRLHKLVSLDLSSNDLNLEPHVFYNLLQNSTVIKELSLNRVNIYSLLPTNLNISSSLRLLNLGHTGLQGNITNNIFNLQSLEELDLSWNYNLHIQSHIFNILLQNSTFLRDVNLGGVNMGFALPTYLNISSSLRFLSVISTGLQGKLPNNILSLEYMEGLFLSENTNLSGPLPKVNTSANTPLTILDLSETSISGEIPTSIGHLNSLIDLDMSLTSLEGEIPTSIGHLKSLEYLDFSRCGLNGSLPKSIGKLRNLIFLYLSDNKLSGTLPSSLFTLSSLEDVNLGNNMFHGNMSLELFSLTSLEELNLANNQLTGHIDVLDNGLIQQTFQRLTNLTTLDLSNNNFRGEWELDTLFSSLTNLEYLYLSYSGISVTTNNANHYVNPHFRTLGLASCNLKVFPVSIRAMKNLGYLDLSSNDIHGHIPNWLGEIGGNQLALLDLSNNSLTGTIPNVYQNWSRLEGFILKENQLEGKVPTSLNKCKKLTVIDLGNNHLNDTFPGWLGALPDLQVLILRSNTFHGGIATSSMVKLPFPRLRVLDLSYNGFVGKLPTKYFQNFNAMKNAVKENTGPEYLYISGKLYSITCAMKGVDQNFPRLSVDYTIADLSNNKFEGEIPNIIGNLNSLIVLNLSHNSLTGRIPHDLGKISEMESLDLSWNQLVGEIPQSLADLTFLEVLNLSQNHLVGRIPQGKQFNTFLTNSFGGNPKLCGPPLPNKCNERMQEPQLKGDGDKDDEKDSGFTWEVVMMGYGCGTLLGFVLGYLMLSTGRPKWFNAIADEVDHMILKRQK